MSNVPPGKKLITFLVSEKESEEIHALAKRNGLSIAALLRLAIAHLKNYGIGFIPKK